MKRKILTLLFALVMCAFSAAGIFTAVPNTVRAGSVYGNAFYNNNVLADLDGATMIDGVTFSPYNFPPDSAGELRVLNIVEYGYSYHEYLNFDYGIVLYLYNPQNLDIVDSDRNKVEMAWAYSGRTPVDYRKFGVEILSRSAAPFENLFIKIRVAFTDAERAELLARLNTNKATRKYDISSIELDIDGAVEDYKVAYAVTASGFAKGLGENLTADSTLSLSFKSFETIELDLQRTYFDNYQDDNISKRLTSVYFAVDNEYWDWYGELQRIKAEWDEYKLKDLLVTESSVIYNGILPYLGKALTSYNEDMDRFLATEYQTGAGPIPPSAEKVYNPSPAFFNRFEEEITTLYLMYKVANIERPHGAYEGGVSGEQLWEDIQNYVNTNFDGDYAAADLFTNDIDSYRYYDGELGKIQRGYSFYDFDYGQPIGSLIGNESPIWEKIEAWLNTGDMDAYETGDYPDILPIKVLSDNDFASGNPAAISKNLFVREEDIPALRQYYENCEKNDQRAVLFRFAVSDYYSEMATIVRPGDGLLDPGAQWNNEAYFASETIFLNFDVIQLTFSKEGQFTVIPVVSNPIDIVNDIVPPVNMPEEFDWARFWKAVGIVATLFVIFVVSIPYWPKIIQGILWVVTSPGRLVRWVFNKGGGG